MKQNIVNQAIQSLKNASEILVFTGAGMSVESNISPFRGKDGLWSGLWGKFVVVYGATPLGWKVTPALTWSYFVSDFYRQIIEANPHEGYYEITRLQNWFRDKKNKELKCVTMNVDGLHQLAGTRNVREVHGSVMRFVCNKCGEEINIPFNNGQYEDQKLGMGWVKRGDVNMNDLQRQHEENNGQDDVSNKKHDSLVENIDREHYAFAFSNKWGMSPTCATYGKNSDKSCTGYARPDATLFGEGLSLSVMRCVNHDIERMVGRDTVCIVIGTSSVVYPAASIPEICAENGATVIEINPEDTPLTPLAHIRVRMAAGDALKEIVKGVVGDS